ncbi:type II toxin-antitoxin system HipA family toxin [Paraburkholderia sp. DHOC27]|uniref:type II toxin-antitoxin system HipA family toxin n=1 Tax=Paraburkholderia sp. DHOC27 TaxID=2303330 RepID=UPI000E3D5848|nr:type II toxin-antitoxin system HipA family toxin [Paraburkholderia sp. DHOC27]RFU44974.1 type II toxin-antitoxin system HipA family toxin [Paraburkholderia sp. DHOC27]
MPRRTQTNRLDLWMNGLPVGYWENARGGETLVYHDAWLADPQGRPLSLSLPFTPGNQPWRGQLVADYFDNLLPDSEPIRRRIASRYQTGGTAPFQLLARLGRDCVGALQMLPPGETPADLMRIRGRPLGEAELARLLRETTTSTRLAQHEPVDDLRLSIAGAQEKTALLYHDDQWLVPEGSTPTTHIFKLPLGRVGNMQADMRTSVENEWLCSKIVAAYGLPIAHCDIGQFEDQKVLIVERFDRRPSSDASWILRLPQEDLCQASGTPALQKYQADGGPGIEDIVDVLAGSERAVVDRRNFFVTQMLFWLLAATDGHAKNFSIAHQSGNRYTSTPLYDVLSAHPIIGRGPNHIAAQKVKLAMAVQSKERHYLLNQIQRRHWIAQGQRIGFAATDVEAMIDELTAQTRDVIDAVATLLPRDFPVDIAEAIFNGMLKLNRKLAAAN